jgi:alginate O-acetyltransferase complex protein AlgI
MLFVELRFFVFLGIVLCIYWSLRTNALRKSFVLLASHYFYGSWDWRFAGMLLLLSAADWYFALRLSSTDNARERKFYVTASVAMNLSVLAFFKYVHFFVGSAVALANTLGVHLSQPTLKIILPVGVSFFTFQSLSYTIDVYRGEILAAKSLRDYLMFASFFPQLVAGPIVRPRYFLPQMESKREVTLEQVKSALYLFLLGYIKKACIADNLSPYVDRVFDHSGAYSATASRIAVWLYTTQIFCDFSGYSDMAIAVAALLGYRLVLNFNAPYLAVSIQEFWRRWHISLSTWIRDYIYISLGGRSKTSRLMTYRNMLLTMLAGGLWHGAAWTFVAWGGAHGTGQVIHQEFQHRVPFSAGRDELELSGRFNRSQMWRSIAGWFVTLNFVCLCLDSHSCTAGRWRWR